MNDEIIKVNFDTSKAVSEAKKLNEQVSALKKAQENLDKQYKSGSISLEEYTKKTNALNAAQKKSQTQLKGIEGGLKNVNDVAKQMGGPGSKAIQALTGSVGGLNTAFKALVANPIIAVATVLVGVFIKLKDAIAGNEETQNRLNKVFSIFRPIGLAVSNIFDKVASFLVTCVEKMAEFIPALETGIQKVAKFVTKFTPLGQIMKAFGVDLSEYTKEAIESFNEQAKVTKNLEERTQALTKAQREFADQQAETQDKIADLQEELAGDLTPDQLIQKTKELGQLRINDAKKQLELKKEELEIELANADLAANSKEDNEKIAKLKREVAQLQRNVNKEEKKASKEETAARKKISDESKKKLTEEAKSRDEELKKRREIENNISDLKIELIENEKKREEARINNDRRKKLQAIDDVYKKSTKSQQKLYDEQKILINQVADLQIKELYGKETEEKISAAYKNIFSRISEQLRKTIEEYKGQVAASIVSEEELIKSFKEMSFVKFGRLKDEYKDYIENVFTSAQDIVDRVNLLKLEEKGYREISGVEKKLKRDIKLIKEDFQRYLKDGVFLGEEDVLRIMGFSPEEILKYISEASKKGLDEFTKMINEGVAISSKDIKNKYKEIISDLKKETVIPEQFYTFKHFEDYHDLFSEAQTAMKELNTETNTYIDLLNDKLYRSFIPVNEEIDKAKRNFDTVWDSLTENYINELNKLRDKYEGLTKERILLYESEAERLLELLNNKKISEEEYDSYIETAEEAQNDALLDLYDSYTIAKDNIDDLYFQRRLNKQKELSNEIAKIEKESAIRTLNLWSEAIGGIGNVFDALAEHEKENSRKQYRLQMMAVYMNMASALAKGISGAAEAGWPAMLATIPATVASLISQFAQVKKLKKEADSAKFSKGGSVFGAGSGTSDDINAKLSNGESVINQRATSMYAPLLSAINQSTGGNPIIAQGNNHTLARELALAVSAQPAPIVAVSDINTGQNRVKYVKTVGKI